MSLNQLYRQTILAHARNPKNKGMLANPDRQATAFNPLCGDQLELSLGLCDGSIERVGTRVRGCALVQASTSMMSELIKHQTMAAAHELGRRLCTLLEARCQTPPAEFEPLAALFTLADRPGRHRCVTLPWVALADCAEEP
jgi:nitrogen fixation NifU-like protein